MAGDSAFLHAVKNLTIGQAAVKVTGPDLFSGQLAILPGDSTIESLQANKLVIGLCEICRRGKPWNSVIPGSWTQAAKKWKNG